MGRSTKESWLDGPGDLREAEVEDVPVPGQSVRVRGLSAAYSNRAQSTATELKIVGTDQIGTVNKATLEIIQFAHGVIEPSFTEEEATQIAEKYGPAFAKVIAKIDELSAIDKEAITEVTARFPAGGEGEDGAELGLANGAGHSGPDVPVRVGGDAGHDDPGDDDG